jgi:hypothetical protein
MLGGFIKPMDISSSAFLSFNSNKHEVSRICPCAGVVLRMVLFTKMGEVAFFSVERTTTAMSSGITAVDSKTVTLGMRQHILETRLDGHNEIEVNDVVVPGACFLEVRSENNKLFLLNT